MSPHFLHAPPQPSEWIWIETLGFLLLLIWNSLRPLGPRLRWIACVHRRTPPRRWPRATAALFQPAKPRRTGGTPKPPWVEPALLALMAEGHDSCRQAAHVFNRLHATGGMTVGKTYVAAVMSRHRYQTETHLSALKHRIPQPIAANRRWAMDCTGKADGAGSGSGSGRVHTILGILDHGTRRALALTVLERANAWTILGHLFLTIGRYGKPRALRTDNASVFRARVFHHLLAIAGIRHEFTTPGSPWLNGRIERLFLTLKEKLNAVVPNDRSALNSLLTQFTFWYNEVRPHQHLDGCTPQEAWDRVDPFRKQARQVLRYSGWHGRLRGLYLRR